jgi:Porin subfamily
MEVEMKMVKSLLLGTAAGLFAVAGAQAADMPVKAKPVLYVKICTLYGDGFYYIPGTDICLKLGGYVRSQHYVNYGNNATNTPFFGTNVFDTRIGPQTSWTHRARSLISVDTRQQTEYGTLRTYFTVGHTSDFTATAASAQAIYANRGFIQFAGFTLGLASSFFDFYSSPIVTYFAVNSEDTGDGGWKVAAYTANFGNGITSTLSLEEPRRMNIVNNLIPTSFNLVAVTGAITPTYDSATIRFPDIVWNWRIDQAWGAAMIGGAVHDASGGYYVSDAVDGIGTVGANPPVAAFCDTPNLGPAAPFLNGTLTGSQLCGHPADKLGWVVTAGLRLNALNGSFFQTQASYTEGALKYLSHTQFPTSNAARFGVGNSLGLGYAMDGIFGIGGEVELTKGWAIYAAYDHVWYAGSRWRTSIYGGYIDVGFNDNAKALIANATCGRNNSLGAIQRVSAVLPMNCDPDWAIAYIGSRTQYNFTPEFYMGFDVLYTKLSTAFAGLGFFNAPAGVARPSGVYAIEDQDNWAVTVRFHRDFKP